jgi:short subunit dehydrogenase-like uncharacterized protein
MRIAVLGATGHTGTLVVRALRERDADVIACGRNEQALKALEGKGVETRRADVTDPAGLQAALRDADAVANLAGPFLRTGMAAARAAIDRALPYCDTTGEQAFMADVRQDLHASARRAGVAVVNALAYEYAFSDLAVRARMPEGGPELHVLYRSRGAQASAGTKKSILRVMGARSLGYEDGRLVEVPAARFIRDFDTAQGARTGISFPGGEILDVPRHTPFRTVRTYVPAKNASVTRALAPAARVILRGPILRAAEAYVDARHKTPRNERAAGEIHLVTRDRHLVVRTPDPYVATAELCAEGILRLGKAPTSGVLAPAEALPAEEVLTAMARRMPEFSVGDFTASPR